MDGWVDLGFRDISPNVTRLHEVYRVSRGAIVEVARERLPLHVLCGYSKGRALSPLLRL
jgi:hypothetical protein